MLAIWAADPEGLAAELDAQLDQLAVFRERRGRTTLLLMDDGADALWLAAKLARGELPGAEAGKHRVVIAAGRIAVSGAGLVGRPVDDCVALLGASADGTTLAVGAIGEIEAPGVERARLGPEATGAALWQRDIWSLEWPGGDRTATELPSLLAGLERESPFFGRLADIEALESAWQGSVQGGARRVAFVSGEAGVGKTRLLARLAARLAGGGATVLYGRCREDSEGAFESLAEALTIEGEPPDWARPGHEPDSELEVRAAVASRLAELSESAPVLLLIDDLHWADRATIALLQHLLDADPAIRGLAVAAFRGQEVEEGTPLAAALASVRARAETVDRKLGGLALPAVSEMAESMLGEVDPGAGELVEMIHAESGGNPLFARELIRSLSESGALGRESEGSAPVGAISLPASVTETIRRRVDRLGEEATETLKFAAIYGPEFESQVLARAMGRNPRDLDGTIAAIERAGLIVQRERAAYAFSHALVARALVESCGPAERGHIDRLLAEALEEGIEANMMARSEALARHWLRADPPDPERAIRYCEIAGQRALAAFRSDAADELFSAALELHGEESDIRRCRLLLGLGRAQLHSGAPEFRDTLLSASRIALALGDDELLAASVLANNRGMFSASGVLDPEKIAMLEATVERLDEDAPELPLVLATLAVELAFSGEDRRFALSDRALEAARRLGDERTLASVLIIRFVTIWTEWTLRERLENMAEAVEIADRLGDPVLQWRAVHWHAVALLQNGEVERCEELVEREVKLARRFGDPVAIWMSTYTRANMALIRGRLDEADELAHEAMRVATESGQPDAVLTFGAQLVMFRWEQGRMAEVQAPIAQIAADNPGVPAFRPAVALACTEGDMFEEGHAVLARDYENRFAGFPPDVASLAALTMYSHACAEIGDAEIGAHLYERLEPFAGELVYAGISVWGDVEHPMARLASLTGRHSTALELIERSLARFEAIPAPTWLARARLDAARIHLGRGRAEDRARALEYLDLAVEGAERYGAATVLRRATVLRENVRAGELIAPISSGRGGGRKRLGMQQRPILSMEGDAWRIVSEGRQIQIKDSIGIRYLAELIQHPGVEMHAVDLQAGPQDARVSAGRNGDAEIAGDDAGPALDDEARSAYRARIEELRSDIEEAERFNDTERVSRLREELEAIAEELAAATGLGGRDRKTASQAERARLNVTRAIRRTIARIATEDPRLAEGLDRAVSTGSFCSYRPLGGAESWTVRIGERS